MNVRKHLRDLNTVYGVVVDSMDENISLRPLNQVKRQTVKKNKTKENKAIKQESFKSSQAKNPVAFLHQKLNPIFNLPFPPSYQRTGGIAERKKKGTL